MNNRPGIFTISLDFELYWGMRDKRTIEQYRENLLGVRGAIDEMLKVFKNNDIHCTWATVGFLFFEDVRHLKENFPAELPHYTKQNLSPYKYISDAEDLEKVYHFASDVIAKIAQHKYQEIATHTFSHYYCQEDGQTLEEFRDDISAAISIAKTKGFDIKSLVFPRNQWRESYLTVLKEFGIQCFRGNESSWLYEASEDQSNRKIQRAARFLDTYINLTGHHTYRPKDRTIELPFDFPASRFLRPYSQKLSFLDGLRLRRIKKAMNHAAKHGDIFHLWWHPHNFGKNTHANISFLEKIIKHYKILQQQYGMQSLNMGELCMLPQDPE